ncbi:hypothetical protein DN762_23915 [Shigella sonnei]|nr:hypothetical protein [Shigella sonnei]EGD9512204.1 hypothetical protein [Escherichia coli]
MGVVWVSIPIIVFFWWRSSAILSFLSFFWVFYGFHYFIVVCLWVFSGCFFVCLGVAWVFCFLCGCLLVFFC